MCRRHKGEGWQELVYKWDKVELGGGKRSGQLNAEEKVKKKEGESNVKDRTWNLDILGTTLRSLLTKTKPENEHHHRENCVHNIPCKRDRKYIGETEVLLQARAQEHQTHIRQEKPTRDVLHNMSRKKNIIVIEPSFYH
ncbi:hypothetical protein Trydic_g5988 [Trypoxylus dichotomus]